MQGVFANINTKTHKTIGYRYTCNRYFYRDVHISRRVRRQARMRTSGRPIREPRPAVAPSLRVRREYRLISDAERERFHRAINMLKEDTVRQYVLKNLVSHSVSWRNMILGSDLHIKTVFFQSFF